MPSALFPRAFTLIELLVVVTIIVVLLALLTPALDKAVYQAQLALCGSNLHGIAVGGLTYAFNFKRRYPHRTFGNGIQHRQPHHIAGPMESTSATQYLDERPQYKGYIDLKLFQDPLCTKIEYENTQEQAAVYLPYHFWFGWRYLGLNARPFQAMTRIGDRFEYETSRFNILAGDYDEYQYRGTNVVSSHPDRDGIMVPNVAEGGAVVPELGLPGGLYLTRWAYTELQRGGLDLNYALDDASVVRYDNVVYEDKRFASAPHTAAAGANGPSTLSEWQVRMPAAD